MSLFPTTPGLVGLLGSGETAAAGGTLFELLASQSETPLTVSVLETPAGFELNADKVAKRVSDFMLKRLQNYQVQVSQIGARRKDGEFGTNDARHLETIADSQMIYMGAGSPTYATRHLKDSLLWSGINVMHGRGSALAFASAAVIAISAYALPVYEIYKVGEDPYWNSGLDFFGAFGLKLAIVPHWNNTDGGDELDTSHCFMGIPRFEVLTAQLPQDVVVLGIDEHTGLVMDFQRGYCRVIGQGSVHLLTAGVENSTYAKNDQFQMDELGDFHLPKDLSAGKASEVIEKYLHAAAEKDSEPHQIPDFVQQLVAERETARLNRDWQRSDALRAQIEAAGWQVSDTPSGPVIGRK